MKLNMHVPLVLRNLYKITYLLYKLKFIIMN
jgi:hypothetical protein